MKKSIRLKEILPLGFVYISAGATIGILFLILGYILFNGFFYNNRVEYTAASYTSPSVAGLVAVVNQENSETEMTFDVLQGLFTDKYANWKKISDSAEDVYPYVSADAAKTAGSLFGKIGRLTEQYDTASAVLLRVAANEGGIGIVTAEEYRRSIDRMDTRDRKTVEKNTRQLQLRNIELACNPEVTELFGNFRIGTLDESVIKPLFSGSVANWQELGGKDLPVVLVVPEDISFYRDAVGGDGINALDELYTHTRQMQAAGSEVPVVTVSDGEQFRQVLAGQPGAVGLLPVWYGGTDTDILKLARNERGWNLTPSFIITPPVDGGRFGGISTIIVNTLVMIILTLLFAVPPGLFAAVYLVEYAKEGRLLRLLRLGTETLAGIPSIIFGLFGMLVFVQGFGWGICLLSGSLTLALMILPTIVRTAEEALKAVPHSLQEGSLALGGTKIQTLFRVVLPAAFPAVSAGIILAIGRALGETAALIYTMGSSYTLTHGLFDSTRSLAVHLYLIIAEGISTDKAFASAAVLIFFVFIINSASKLLIRRIGAAGT